ncbi:acyltransferase [Oscillibacter sp.]|uniref:acyltransferase family protein n=1 Tax=Oscillibacter sp. TaxID=1945593 RepID=UPI00260BEEFA|nr:acyltransferase [Oscillibacter sp.]MDD3346469.1 acyltransferase [Oscillibacter sp.]
MKVAAANLQKERFLWMDVLRGLLILSVVIGHSTGRFNSHIYQFHMGAFFFVSGYMARQERRSVLETLYHRMLTTLLPVVSSAILLLGVTALMNATGVYTIFFSSNLAYAGASFTIKELFFHGRFYVWWLGACWFILALFNAAIFNRLLFQICGKRYSLLYMVGLVIMFLFGYSATTTGSHNFDWDLALIASFYYGIGSISAKYTLMERLSKNRLLCGIGLLISGGLAYLVAHHFFLRMDWPSRSFNHPAVDILLVLNGLTLMFFLAVFLIKAPVVCPILSYLGKNTLPIVLFHFMWFNLGFYILYLMGQVSFSYLQNFTPQDDISYIWWWLFVLIGIIGSILLWQPVQHCKPLRIIFGQEKSLYLQGWKKINSFENVQKVDHAVDSALTFIDGQQLHAVKAKLLRHKRVVIFVMALISLVAVTTVVALTNASRMPSIIEFPTNSSESIGEGWLPQSENEDYRWTSKQSTVTLEANDHVTTFVLEGYIPETYTEVNKISIYMEDNLIYDQELSAGEGISIAQEISPNFTTNQTVKIQLEFNAEHNPDANDPDQRIMSMLVTKIGFQ